LVSGPRFHVTVSPYVPVRTPADRPNCTVTESMRNVVPRPGALSVTEAWVGLPF
jgi:hypothetical protein